METGCIVVECVDGDLSRGMREFHGIVDQVPKHLLKSDAISQYVMLFGVQIGREL